MSMKNMLELLHINEKKTSNPTEKRTNGKHFAKKRLPKRSINTQNSAQFN